MKQFKCAYGKGYKGFSLREENLLKEIWPNEAAVESRGEDEIRRALELPTESKRLKDMVRPGQRICIVTSDITRPLPGRLVLPLVLEELCRGGVSDADITVVFAVGCHRKHSEEEKKRLVGEAVNQKIRCVDSDPGSCVNLGRTRWGTPVDVFTEVADSDVRICLGNIEYHWFAGYSGGTKAVMPGVSSREAIRKNHGFLAAPSARAGNTVDNPVRTDIEDFGEILKVHFIVNVVLDEHKNVVKAVAGHPVAAHREGCRFLDGFYKIPVPRPADIVVVSAGGYPKDINLYQAQKALDNARAAVREGGIVIWAAKCPEGLGEAVFEEWMLTASGPGSILERIKTEFRLGGHKAAGIATVLVKAQIFLVSDLKADLVERIFMRPFQEIDTALDEAFSQLGRGAEVLFMPVGGSTLPVLEG